MKLVMPFDFYLLQNEYDRNDGTMKKDEAKCAFASLSHSLSLNLGFKEIYIIFVYEPIAFQFEKYLWDNDNV